MNEKSILSNSVVLCFVTIIACLVTLNPTETAAQQLTNGDASGENIPDDAMSPLPAGYKTYYTSWQYINKVYVNNRFGGKYAAWVKMLVNGKYVWLKHTNTDPQTVALFESIILTAFTTGKQVKVYYWDDDSTEETENEILGIWMR